MHSTLSSILTVLALCITFSTTSPVIIIAEQPLTPYTHILDDIKANYCIEPGRPCNFDDTGNKCCEGYECLGPPHSQRCLPVWDDYPFSAKNLGDIAAEDMQESRCIDPGHVCNSDTDTCCGVLQCIGFESSSDARCLLDGDDTLAQHFDSKGDVQESSCSWDHHECLPLGCCPGLICTGSSSKDICIYPSAASTPASPAEFQTPITTSEISLSDLENPRDSSVALRYSDNYLVIAKGDVKSMPGQFSQISTSASQYILDSELASGFPLESDSEIGNEDEFRGLELHHHHHPTEIEVSETSTPSIERIPQYNPLAVFLPEYLPEHVKNSQLENPRENTCSFLGRE